MKNIWGYGFQSAAARSPEKHQRYGPMADAVWIEIISSTKTGKDEDIIGRSHTKHLVDHSISSSTKNGGPWVPSISSHR